jgi:hypothetical protein
LHTIRHTLEEGLSCEADKVFIGVHRFQPGELCVRGEIWDDSPSWQDELRIRVVTLSAFHLSGFLGRRFTSTFRLCGREEGLGQNPLQGPTLPRELGRRSRSRVEGDKRTVMPRPRRWLVLAVHREWQDDGTVIGLAGGGIPELILPRSWPSFRAGHRSRMPRSMLASSLG